MWEKLFIFDEAPDFDVVPVLKLCRFPYSEDSYRPFCHLALYYVKGDGLYFGFKAFEAKPKINPDDIFGGSALSVSLGNADNSRSTVISFDAEGKYVISPKVSAAPVISNTTTGGDQQGDYFIITMKLPLSLIRETIGIEDIKEGDKINLNAFYTVLDNNLGYKKHFAALFDKGEKNDEKAKISDPENRGTVTAVEFY